MKQIFALIFLLVTHEIIQAQVETFTALNFNGDNYDVFKVKIDQESLKSFEIFENRTGQPHQSYVASISAGTPFFIINASISDSFCNPLGYYVKDSKLINPANLSTGTGNFYLKPNGALLFTSTQAIICESSQISSNSNVRLGIQSGPMLLVNGEVNAQFNPNSQNKNIRCGVGIQTNQKNESFLVFCIANTPVSFYNFSLLFKQKFKCSNALCLESGSCAMNLPYLSSSSEKLNDLICNYIFFPIR